MFTKSVSLFASVLALFSSTLASAQGIVITSGANCIVNGNANLIVNDGGLNNSGTFVPGNGTVFFSGTANATITSISGTSSTSFYNLGINKSAGTAKLSRNIAVSNSLLMQLGNLDLSGFDLDLGSTGNIAGESASSAVQGPSGGAILRTINLNAPSAVNPGNMGIEITSTANLGLTTIRRGNQQQVNSSGYGINRYYDIVPANNTALNATLKFYYLDNELATINESELKLWSSANSGASWTLLGSDAQDAAANFVLKNGIGQFNRVTLASSVSHPLPVFFLSFSGQILNNNVQLSWSTGFELNNHHFEMEKSADGRNFSLLAKVLSSGNSNATSSYQSTDFNAFANSGLNYYRIKQVNNDGTFSYSKVLSFSRAAYANAFISVYPNPSNGPVHLRFTSNGALKTTLVQVVDLKGRLIEAKSISIQNGLNDIPYDVSHLAQGTYFLKLSGIEDRGISIIKN